MISAKIAGMKVVHAAAELYPLVKTGGLADVVGALPAALLRAGADARVIVPGYPAMLAALRDSATVAELGPIFGAPRVTLRFGRLEGVAPGAYVIDAPALYDRAGGPYDAPDGWAYGDNLQRFALLGNVAARLGAGVDPMWRADVVHAHDWHAGLAPAYMSADPANTAKSVFTIHNLAYQGNFWEGEFQKLGLPAHYMRAHGGLEFWRQVSFIKAGIVFARRVTTVSPTYAREITTAEFGCSLDAVLRERGGDLRGILNGIDENLWNPALDPHCRAGFDVDALDGKAECKIALQQEFELDRESRAPLFAVVSRLSHQKGLDLVLGALPTLLGGGAQFVMLGAGDPHLEHAFASAAREHRGRIGVRVGYDETLAHRIIAGADALLVPSRFEPCGLTQLYALRYGTLPVVRRTGGLADSVDEAVGFLCGPAEASIHETIKRAIDTYRNAERWRTMQLEAMRRDHGWSASASQYLSLYGE